MFSESGEKSAQPQPQLQLVVVQSRLDRLACGLTLLSYCINKVFFFVSSDALDFYNRWNIVYRNRETSVAAEEIEKATRECFGYLSSQIAITITKLKRSNLTTPVINATKTLQERLTQIRTTKWKLSSKKPLSLEKLFNQNFKAFKQAVEDFIQAVCQDYHKYELSLLEKPKQQTAGKIEKTGRTGNRAKITATTEQSPKREPEETTNIKIIDTTTDSLTLYAQKILKRKPLDLDKLKTLQQQINSASQYYKTLLQEGSADILEHTRLPRDIFFAPIPVEANCATSFRSPEKQYHNLIVLLHLFTPSATTVADGVTTKSIIEERLRCQLTLLQKHFYFSSKLPQIENALGETISEMLRLQRIIDVYKQWKTELIQVTKKFLSLFQSQSHSNRMHHRLSRVMQLHGYLTYSKKKFFEKSFNEQTAIKIINSLNEVVSARTSRTSPSSTSNIQADRKNTRAIMLLCDSQNLKETLKKKTQQQEAELINELSKTFSTLYSYYLYSILGYCGLGITEQPTYQLGQFSIMASLDLSNQYPDIPVLGEKLPEQMQKCLEHAEGLAFLGITLYVSNWYGYSYHLISMIDRILLSNINLLIQTSELIDSVWKATGGRGLRYIKRSLYTSPKKKNHPASHPSQLWMILDKIEQALRFDELGLIKKLPQIRWLTRLCIHLALSFMWNYIENYGEKESFDFLPSTIAYVAATALSECISWGIGEVTDRLGFDKTVKDRIKVLSHFLSYPFGYRLGYQGGHYLSQITREAMNERTRYAEALNIFGLNAPVKAETVKTKFRELAKQHHPDKCRGNLDCITTNTEKMQSIYEAHDILTKGMGKA